MLSRSGAFSPFLTIRLGESGDERKRHAHGVSFTIVPGKTIANTYSLSRLVTTIGSPSVITMVCSKCALFFPSAVVTVKPSS